MGSLTSFLSFFLLFFTSLVYGGFNLSNGIREPNALARLKVTLDFPLATSWYDPAPTKKKNLRNFVYSSHLVFNNPVHELFNNKQLWAMARTAFDEMRQSQREYDIAADPRKAMTPGAMSILAWDKEIIFTSSQRGVQSIIYDGPPSAVKADLDRCMAEWREEHEVPGDTELKHGNKAKCGEEMSAHLYSLFNRDKPLGTRGATIATWVVKKEDINDAEPKEPCSHLKTYGCREFVPKHGLRVLDITDAIVPKDKPPVEWSLEGTVMKIIQYQMCEQERTFASA